MKIHYEISSVADAKRAQVMLAAYINSVNEPAAAMAVRERLARPQIHPLKPASKPTKHNGGWTAAKKAAHSAKLKAAWKRRKQEAGA